MDSKPIYKTAEELGIEQWERDGLVALVGPLSCNLLRLKMTSIECGTTRCIGGHIARNAHIRSSDYVMRDSSAALIKLFFPTGGRGGDGLRTSTNGWAADAHQAARAIVNFLVTGDPQWDAVMREA